MENLKKWFNFDNTISGITFIMRWVIANVIQFGGGFMLGYGLVLGNIGLTTIGLITAAIGILLQFSTLMKRCKAIFPKPKDYLVFYVAYVLVGIIYGFVKDLDPVISGFSGIVMIVMFCIVIFKNSGNPEIKHLG
jgi:hypothetical protein